MNMSNIDWEIRFSYQLFLVGADPGGEIYFQMLSLNMRISGWKACCEETFHPDSPVQSSSPAPAFTRTTSTLEDQGDVILN